MISVSLTTPMLNSILAIEQCRTTFQGDRVPPRLSSRMRKNSKKKSSHASTKIEGNPLTEEQAEQALEDVHRHFLQPEEEVRNYYAALQIMEERLKQEASLSLELLLEIQRTVVAGSSAEKIGLRGPMPPGVLFAVYDSVTGVPDYIPPEASEVPALLDELFSYVEDSDDHPLVKAGVIHYQIATIHPFEDGNGRTARALSYMMLLRTGYDFFRYFSISGLIAEERGRYYKAMRQVETSGNDMTYFIDYYSAMLSRSVDRMKEHLLGHVLTEKRMNALQATGRLNERQLKGARWLLEGKTAQVTVDAWKKKFRTATETARQDLLLLCKEGVLEREMEGRKAVFIIRREE